MSRRLSVPVLLLAGLVALPGPVAASQEAHEHGHIAVLVAQEGDELVVEVHAPGVNVVGFEHRPESDADRATVAGALARFVDGGAMLRPSTAAGCELGFAEATLGGLRRHRGKVHGKDEHDSEHGTTKRHDDHGHDKEHAAGHTEAHDELEARYVFHCHAPGALEALEVDLFAALRDVDEIGVEVVTPTVQSAMVLAPGKTRVPLAR